MWINSQKPKWIWGCSEVRGQVRTEFCVVAPVETFYNDTTPAVQSKCTGFQEIGSFSVTVAELGEMETCFFSETWYPYICPNMCMRCEPALASVVMGCVCWFLVYFPVSFLCYCLEFLVSQSFICLSRPALFFPLCPHMMSLASSLYETLSVSFGLIR